MSMTVVQASLPFANPKEPVRIYLASQSPRRHELLTGLGLAFAVVNSEVDETAKEGLAPEELVLGLSAEKALVVAAKVMAADVPSVVIGADTIVVLEGDILGKPRSQEEAVAMLSRLSGKCHLVYTGVSLVTRSLHRNRLGLLQGVSIADQEILSGGERLPVKLVSTFAVSRVYFRNLEMEEIIWYAQLPEPMDKAGAYALQGTGSAFVERVEGCFTNVIGLPIPLTVHLLRASGVQVLGLP